MRARKSVCTMLLLLSASGASAERLSCWDSQMSQILAHDAGQTLGNFELGGVSTATATPTNEPVLAYKCTGTFILGAQRKQYSYLCELRDEAGDKFALQNSDAGFGATQYVAGGGTGKYAERAGAAAEYENFPINRDGSLPSCDPNQSALRLP
jgi:hypothetical protein